MVFAEAGRGDEGQARARLEAIKPFRMLDVADEAHVLAGKIVAGHGVPREFPEDALHLAIAALNGLDAFVTWNFAHMNNPFTRMTIREIVEDDGYRCPEICFPEELLEN